MVKQSPVRFFEPLSAPPASPLCKAGLSICHTLMVSVWIVPCVLQQMGFNEPNSADVLSPSAPELCFVPFCSPGTQDGSSLYLNRGEGEQQWAAAMPHRHPPRKLRRELSAESRQWGQVINAAVTSSSPGESSMLQ